MRPLRALRVVRLVSWRASSRRFPLTRCYSPPMTGEILWLGPAIQGGIGVVSLVVMFLLLGAFIKSMDRRMAQFAEIMMDANKAISRVTSMVAVLLGREDATPAQGIELPDPFSKRRRANANKKPKEEDSSS